MLIDWKENPVLLDHIMLFSYNPDRLAAFYRDCLCMTMSRHNSLIKLENKGRKLLISKGESRKLGFGAFVFSDEGLLTKFRENLDQCGFNLKPSPSPIFTDSSFSL